MEKIYSNVDKDKLLHIVCRISDIDNQIDVERVDVIDADNFLQCSTLKMSKGRTFKPHKHIHKERHHLNQIAQESWVIIRGSVKCIFYDIDDTIIAEPILYAGDASFTLLGGHNYEILEDDTVVYEYKTGPYEGQKQDKQFLND